MIFKTFFSWTLDFQNLNEQELTRLQLQKKKELTRLSQNDKDKNQQLRRLTDAKIFKKTKYFQEYKDSWSRRAMRNDCQLSKMKTRLTTKFSSKWSEWSIMQKLLDTCNIHIQDMHPSFRITQDTSKVLMQD